MRSELYATLTLDLPPSCIAFVPSYPNDLLVGTYHLKDPGSTEGGSSTQRNGSLSLYRMTHKMIKPIHTYSLDYAILDLKFSPSDPAKFAYATSNGLIFICLFESRTDFVSKKSVVNVAPSPDTLVLSLAWAPTHLHSDFIAVTLSTGEVSIVDSVGLTSKLNPHHSHSLEAWVVAWSRATDHPAVYSGGDDSALYFHRLNNDKQLENIFNAPLQDAYFVRDNRIHGAGVTSMVPLWINEQNCEYLLTGSYDEHVRIVQIKPGFRKPHVLAEERLDGGVWQLRQIEVPEPAVIESNGSLSFAILASCMHAGCRVLEIHRTANGDWTIEILGRFEGHASMNYASDARQERTRPDLKDLSFVSTSFYDKKMCVWKLDD